MSSKCRYFVTSFDLDIQLPDDCTAETAAALAAIVLDVLQHEQRCCGVHARVLSRPEELTLTVEGIEPSDNNADSGVDGVESIVRRIREVVDDFLAGPRRAEST